MFAQAGVQYEDVRVTKEEWLEMKPKTPTGMLPLLEVDGKQIAGSMPIARFLARRLNLEGSNEFEAAEIDSMNDVVFDFLIQFMTKVYPEKDEAKKAEAVKDIKDNAFPKYWGVIEKRLQSNEDVWISGNKPSYADFSIYNYLDFVLKEFPAFLDEFPAVAKLRASVEALPKIAEWLKNRPKNDM